MDQKVNGEQVHEQVLVNTEKFNKLSSLREKLPSDKKRLIILVFIVVAIPVTVALALAQQEIRSRASEYPATPATPPNTQGKLFSRGTDHVYLRAEEVSININGKVFNPAKGTDLIVNSNAPFPPEMNKTTLEFIWQENGVEMRMFIYIEKDNQNNWFVSQIWTYNGTQDGKWVYFDGFPGAKVGEALEESNLNLSSNSKSDDKATIDFKNLYLKPFLVEIPQKGYYIYRTNSDIKLISKSLTYGAYGLLFKDGSIVKDQAGYVYDWSVDNPNIKLTPEVVCVGGVSTPCGKQRVAVKVNSVSDQGIIYLTIKDPNGNILSSTTFGVNRPPSPSPVADFRIEGKYVDENGNLLNVPGLGVTLLNKSTNATQSSNSAPGWSFKDLQRADYQITAKEIPGYKIEHMVCYNCIDKDKFFSTSSFTLGKTNSDFVGVTFKYTKIANLTPSPLPGNKVVTLKPTADAFVKSNQINKNFGSQTKVEAISEPNTLSLFKYNLSSLAGKTIVKATFNLKISDPSVGIQTLRRGDDKAWGETTVTYSNKPSNVAAITTFTSSAVNQVISLPVTNAVNLKKGGNLTLIITSAGKDRVSFYSRESGINSPTLTIEYK